MVENVQHTRKESKVSYLKSGFFRKKPTFPPADVPARLTDVPAGVFLLRSILK